MDGNADGGEGRTVTLTAKVGDNDATTRVGMTKGEDSYADFYWHSDDAVLVQTVDGGTLTVTADMTVVWSGHSNRTGNGYFLFYCCPLKILAIINNWAEFRARNSGAV